MKSTKFSENDLPSQFIKNRESTMAAAPARSAGAVLLKLGKTYLRQEGDLDKLYKVAIKKIEEEASKRDLTPLMDFLHSLIQQPHNQLDRVTLFLPKDNDPTTFENKLCHFPVKQVLTLVWTALTDSKICEWYISTEKNKEEALAKLYKARLDSFFNCLSTLHDNPLCHQGSRNELVFLLNKIHPDVDLIEDPRSTILSFLKEEINRRFVETYAKSDQDTKENLKKAIIAWFSREDASEIIQHLDPWNTLRTALHKLFIAHGIDPEVISLDGLINDSLSSVTFSCKASEYPQLYYPHLILHQFRTNSSQPKEQQIALEWMQNYLEKSLFESGIEERLQTFCHYFECQERYRENSSSRLNSLPT